MSKMFNLIIIGGAGLAAYRFYYEKWPWEGELFPPSLPDTKEECLAQGYYWYDGACHLEPEEELTVSSIDMPATVSAGEEFDVVATVENSGGEEATAPIDFTQNGTVLKSPEITVPAGGSKEVTFTHIISTKGNYEICVELG